MGALLAFEIARVMRRIGHATPIHLFVSSCAAPHIRHDRPVTYDLSEQEFIATIRRLNGTPPAIFNHLELLSLLLPMLRADFQMCETHSYQSDELLEIDITALGGDEDVEINSADLNAWSELTNGRFRLHRLSGDHFFLHQFEQKVLTIISAQLEAVVKYLA